MIEAATGAQFNHVPYKGVGPAYQDLIGGRVDFMLTDLASVRQYIDAGKVIALAVTDKTRLLPNVPTPAEGGVSGITAFTSFSVMVPAKTQPAVVNRIAGEIQKAMKDPALVHKLEQQALVPVADTPEQFAASLKEEQQNWGTFIKQQNIQPE
jgi:tripartite-type tricarboxylate transporter receptor subunit TctC